MRISTKSHYKAFCDWSNLLIIFKMQNTARSKMNNNDYIFQFNIFFLQYWVILHSHLQPFGKLNQAPWPWSSQQGCSQFLVYTMLVCVYVMFLVINICGCMWVSVGALNQASYPQSGRQGCSQFLVCTVGACRYP